MGFLTDFFELKRLAKEIKKGANLDSTNMRTAAACWTKAKAISAQASKYVLEYPVACTNQITDYARALAIAKQVELDCARFVILASGLNPIVDRKNGDTIEAHLNEMISSFESYGLPCTIEPATKEFIAAGKEYMDNYYSTELYSTYKDDMSEESLVQSNEMDNVNAFTDNGDDPTIPPATDINGNVIDNDYDKMFENVTHMSHGRSKDGTGGSIMAGFQEPSEQEFKDIYYNMTGTELKTPEELAASGADLETARANYNKYYNKYLQMRKTSINNTQAAFNNNADILKKLQNVGPTIITITLYLTDGAGGQRAIQLPLAIKSSIQFIESPDLMRVLAGTQNNSRNLAKFIKVTTGQMSFFKDWLFAINETNSDIEREQALGTVPIFRRLLDAKNRYRVKTIAATRPRLAKFVAGKSQKDLPMCTIVCTTEELEEAFKQKWTYIYKNRKIIDEIIDTYMLLGFGVVDTTSDYIYIFYAGEADPQIIEMSKLGGGGSTDPNKALADALVNTTRLLARH